MRVWSFWMESKGLAGEGGGKYTAGGPDVAQRQSLSSQSLL